MEEEFGDIIKETGKNLDKTNINEENSIPDIKELSKQLNKDIFFNASIATTKTNIVWQKRLEVDMLEIYKKINEAINNGKYELVSNLTEDQRRFLINKGYYINQLRAFADGIIEYRIKWPR